MTRNHSSVPCLWSAYHDRDEEGGGDGVRRRVSGTTPSPLLLPASLAGPSCGRTPAASSRTPARGVRSCSQERTPSSSSQVRTPSSSSSSAQMKTPSQQARRSFAAPTSPITPSTGAPSSSTSSARATAAAAGPCARGTLSARRSSSSGATTTSRRFSHVRSTSAPSGAPPFAHRAPPPARGPPPPHRRSAPTCLASMPAEPTATGRSTAAGTLGGTPELATPVMASSTSFGDVGAAASAVHWTGSGGGGGDHVGWDFDEFDYGMDRGPAGRRSSVRLFKIFGSKTGTDDSEDNYETGECEEHGDGDGGMFGSPAVPAPLSEASLNPRSVGVNGVKQQVPSGFRSAGTTEAVAGAGAGAGAEHNDMDIVSDDDGEAPASPTLASGDSSFHSALSAKEDEGNSRGSLRPHSAPQRSASVSGENDDLGGGGVAWGDAAAVRLLPRALGVPTCDNNRYSSPMPFGAGTDYEVLIPGGGGGGGAEGAAVLVSQPPRLRRLRLSADGSPFECNARRPPIYRRKRRNHVRQPSHGDEPGTAATDSSTRAGMQQRKWYPDALLDSSSDEEDDEDTTRILGRVPPNFLQVRNTSDGGGGTPGGTLGSALKSPGVALRTPTYSSSAHAAAVARADTARAKGVVRGPSRDGEKEAGVEGGTMQGRRKSAPNQEAEVGVETGQEAGMVRRRLKSTPATNVPPLWLRSSSFAYDLVVALEDLDQPEEAEEEAWRRRQQQIDRRNQPDSASAAQQQEHGRGRYKKRSTSLGQQPWSRSRGRSRSGRGGSGTNSRRGSSTSGGGGSKRGSEILGKIKGMLSLEPRQSSPAVRPMSRIELHKAQLAAEAFRSPGTRPASSSFEDEPCPEDELFERAVAAMSQKGAGRGGNRRVPGWRSRSRGAPGGGRGGFRETVMKL